MSWNRRFENIGQRDWDALVRFWTEFGRGFDTVTFLESSLDDIFESRLEPGDLTTNSIRLFEFADRTPFLNELVFTQVKANHAFLCALRRVSDGNATWGVTDAYHASMLLMRSILSAFGIFICRVHNKNVLIDAYPWLGRIDHQKSFKRRHENWRNCVAVITAASNDFAQQDLYSLFQRVLNVSTVPTSLWPEVVVQNIIKTPKTHFSSSRNKIIYGSRFWFHDDDLLGECLSLNWAPRTKRDILVYSFLKHEDATEVENFCDCLVLFCLSRRLQENIYAGLTDSVGVFDYVEQRRVQLGIGLIELQFSGSL
jgi:hypothetical protein